MCGCVTEQNLKLAQGLQVLFVGQTRRGLSFHDAARTAVRLPCFALQTAVRVIMAGRCSYSMHAHSLQLRSY